MACAGGGCDPAGKCVGLAEISCCTHHVSSGMSDGHSAHIDFSRANTCRTSGLELGQVKISDCGIQEFKGENSLRI